MLVQNFGETEVGQLDMPIRIKEDILRLQVPVNDSTRMQVVKGQHKFRGVKSGDRLSEFSGQPKMEEKLAAAAVV